MSEDQNPNMEEKEIVYISTEEEILEIFGQERPPIPSEWAVKAFQRMNISNLTFRRVGEPSDYDYDDPWAK